jgi:hypothetical protein
MSDNVLVRCSYFQQPDGSYLEVRHIGRHIVAEPAPVLFLEYRKLFAPAHWSPEKPFWALHQEPSSSLALVKEGPKALTICHRGD